MSDTTKTAAMFLIGIGVGQYLPGLPAPLNVVNQYLGIIFIVIGVVLLIKG